MSSAFHTRRQPTVLHLPSVYRTQPNPNPNPRPDSQQSRQPAVPLGVCDSKCMCSLSPHCTTRQSANSQSNYDGLLIGGVCHWPTPALVRLPVLTPASNESLFAAHLRYIAPASGSAKKMGREPIATPSLLKTTLCLLLIATPIGLLSNFDGSVG